MCPITVSITLATFHREDDRRLHWPSPGVQRGVLEPRQSSGAGVGAVPRSLPPPMAGLFAPGGLLTARILLQEWSGALLASQSP